MASRRVELPDVGTVVLTKRKASHSLRLSIGHDGTVRVSLPTWSSYQAGLRFVQTKTAWIINQQRDLKQILRDGQMIGKAHHVRLEASTMVSRISTKLEAQEAIVRFPTTYNPDDPAVQRAAQTASIKALRAEAEQLLPQRLAQLARQHGFSYRSVAVRHLKSRWGSCNERGDITLNLFLMQLPWQLIDYVLLHELTHTKVLRHGPPFWAELSRHLPEAKSLRRTMLAHRPIF